MFCEFLVATGSIQDPRGYLPAVLDQGPGCIESFGRVGLQILFYQVIFHFERTHQSSHHHNFALCRCNLIIGHYQAGRLGLHSHISSSPRHSIWHLRSTDALYACRISSPKMNSFVIFGMNFQWALSEGHHQENFIYDGEGFPQTSFAPCRIGSAAFQAIWQLCRVRQQSCMLWCQSS
jgi:hypothetical protein